VVAFTLRPSYRRKEPRATIEQEDSWVPEITGYFGEDRIRLFLRGFEPGIVHPYPSVYTDFVIPVSPFQLCKVK